VILNLITTLIVGITIGVLVEQYAADCRNRKERRR
jgi:hypothetical protein